MSRRTHSLRRHSAVVTASAVLLLASGCAASGNSTGQAAASSPLPTTAGYPVTVTNCGTPVTVGAAPERIITIKSSATEMLLALGLGGHVVGSAFLDGPLPASLDSASKLNVISDFLPGQESVLGLAPDFIYGGWESNFTADGVGERSSLADLGIGTYVSLAACKGDAMPRPLTFSMVFAEITEAGAVFGAADQAAALVAAQEAALAALTPAAGARTALWFSSGTDSPDAGAGLGSPEMIMSAARLTNVFADVKDTWTSVSWEAVIAANPSVIVLVDATWNTAASKIATLENNPATKGLDAVLNKRYVILPVASTEAGIRNVEAAASTIDQLAAFGK